MGPDVARDEINVVLLDQLVGGLLAGFRCEAVVAEDHFDIQIARFAAQMLDGEVHRVFHLVADHGGGGGERGDEADLDRFRLRDAREHCGGQCRRDNAFHGSSLVVRPFLGLVGPLLFTLAPYARRSAPSTGIAFTA